MQLNFSQQMRMSQQMKLAPRMIQSMEILQLPIMALQERIDQELEENVVLEVEAKALESTTETEQAVELERANEEAKTSTEEKEIVVDSDNENDFERLDEIAKEWPEDNVFTAAKPSANRLSDISDRKHDAIANIETNPQTLREYLLEQFHFFNMPTQIRDFGIYLIHYLDSNGRVQGTLAEIKSQFDQPISMEDALEALYFIQRLDPPGVGARDLKECLVLQVTETTPLRDVVVTLLKEHLTDLAQNRLPVIQKKTGYAIETIKDALLEIQKFDPFPGREFEVQQVQKVTPDLSVERDNKSGKYIIKLEDEYTPTLRISKHYREMLRNGADKQTKEYIKKKIDSAKWLIESIEQRYSTLKRVAQAIVDFQQDFLENGPESIVPLKMQQVADVVGVHVTTVSRAVDDKWIQTPRGLFPLKRFFGGGTKTAEGEDIAWDKIRLRLKEIVDNEDKDKPLSDDSLVEALAEHGYKLARRTVTKYRKKLGIASSRQRREY